MSQAATGNATNGRPGRERVVVAGGTGFIGSHLVPALVAEGYEVVVLSRSHHPDDAGVRYLQWDPAADEAAAGAWQESLSGAAAVINLTGASAAAKRWNDARKRVLVESRVRPSRALVAASNRLAEPPAAILQASGVNYYGPGEDPRNESDPPGEDFLAQLACAWEAPLDETLIRTVAMRFGAVLHPHQGALPQMLMPFRLFAGGPVAGGRQWLSWIHVRDVVAAIAFLIRSPLAGPVNVTSPNPVRNRDFARAAARALGRPAWLPTPRWVVRLAVGEAATMVCDGVQALPAKLEGAGFGFQYPDLDHALADLIR